MKITEHFFNKSLSQKLVYTYIFFILVSVLLTASFMYYFVKLLRGLRSRRCVCQPRRAHLR